MSSFESVVEQAVPGSRHLSRHHGEIGRRIFQTTAYLAMNLATVARWLPGSDRYRSISQSARLVFRSSEFHVSAFLFKGEPPFRVSENVTAEIDSGFLFKPLPSATSTRPA